MIYWSAKDYVEDHHNRVSSKRFIPKRGEHEVFSSSVGTRAAFDAKAKFFIGGRLQHLDHLHRRFDTDRQSSGWSAGGDGDGGKRHGKRHGGLERVYGNGSSVSISGEDAGGALAAVASASAVRRKAAAVPPPSLMATATALPRGVANFSGELPQADLRTQKKHRGVTVTVASPIPLGGINRRAIPLPSGVEITDSDDGYQPPLSASRRKSRPHSRTPYVSHSLATLLKNQRGHTGVFADAPPAAAPSHATRRRQFADSNDLMETTYAPRYALVGPAARSVDVRSSVRKLRGALPATDKAANLILRRAFRKFDLDRRGSVSRAEFRRGLQRVGVALNRVEIDALVAIVENGGGQTIDFNYEYFADYVVTVSGQPEGGDDARAPPPPPVAAAAAAATTRRANAPPRSRTSSATATAAAAAQRRKWGNFRAEWANKHGGGNAAVLGDLASARPFRVVHARVRAPLAV